jgi:hypothetical protein
MMADPIALSREGPREDARRRLRQAGEPARRAPKIGRRHPTLASAQETKCPLSNNLGNDSRQGSRHSTHYAIRGGQRLCSGGNNLPRDKYNIYLQLQKRLKIRLEPDCATQYYIFTINKPPMSFREFPCWSAADVAMCVRDLQTRDSSRFGPDRLSPTPQIEPT